MDAPSNASYSERAFRDVCGRFPTGVAVATGRGVDGAPVGITINSFASVSLAPPLVLFCLDRGACSAAVFTVRRPFACNFLTESQQALSQRFATPGENKFENIAPAALMNPDAAPLLPDCLGWLVGRVETVVPMGDHHVIFGAVTMLELGRPARPLLYYGGAYAAMA